MQSVSIQQLGDQPRTGTGRAPRRPVLVWLAAAAIGSVIVPNVGCASASRWAASQWSWARATAENPADPAAAIAATDLADHSAAEDPRVTEAFARLEQAQAEMRRQSQTVQTIAQANHPTSPSAAPSAEMEHSSTVR